MWTRSNLLLTFNAVKCNLMELTTRSTSFAFVVSGLLDMRMCQDSSCSYWRFSQRFVSVSVFLSVGSPWRLSRLPCPSLSFHCFISVTGSCFLPPCGGSWLGCLDLPAMGAVSIWELAANSGSSWMSQAPNLHFARQLLINVQLRGGLNYTP